MEIKKIKVVIDSDTVYPGYPCEEVYRASDVDAMLSDVRRLVEAVGEYAGLAGGVHEYGCPEDDTCSCHVMIRFEKAIAAVERHLRDA